MTPRSESAADPHEHRREVLHFVGKIRDPLHDTIPFTGLEKQVMDRPEFQRLRRIRQTAFIRYVFPGATHTRFEHSLGVMHVAGLMCQRIVENQARLLGQVDNAVHAVPQALREEFNRNEEGKPSLRHTRSALRLLTENAHLTQLARLAALLHDVGHAPFSHSGERFLATWGELEAQLANLALPDWLQEGLKAKCAALRKRLPGAAETRVRHEVYTLLVVARIFDGSQRGLDPHLGQDLCAILDHAVAPSPSGLLEKSGLRTLMHEIVSGEIDADRMDYLLRDSRQCGVVYGLYDLGRLLDSLAFYWNPVSKRHHMAIRRSGVAALEDYLRARWSMYQQVYFHKTSTSCEAMLECFHRNAGRFKLPLDVEAYLEWDDESFFHKLSEITPAPSAFAKGLMRDLLLHRRLWKRVYEENAVPGGRGTPPSFCPAVSRFLRDQRVPSEMIENNTSLTRFAPKVRQRETSNTLMVVVKDVHAFRFLEPIEDHSRLVNRLDEETSIRRVFVGRETESGIPIDHAAIQRLVSSQVISPSSEDE